MGGGAGASIHGRFRVATENSVYVSPTIDSECASLAFKDRCLFYIMVLYYFFYLICIDG